MKMKNKSTYLGTVQDVKGTTVGVTLSNDEAIKLKELLEKT